MNMEMKGVVAVIHSDVPLITDAQSALDLIATVDYEYGAKKVVINKAAISEDFFKLSTGFAGEVVQRFVTYQCRLAIVGDFSRYTSKPLRDYMRECNEGSHLFFAANEDEALKKFGE